MNYFVQSGTTFHIVPIAKDSQGNEVGLSKVGQLTLECGKRLHFTDWSILCKCNSGIWNVSVNSSSGASGNGVIRVLPAQATGLSIEIDTQQARTGSPVNLSAIRTDILGNNGEITLPLSNGPSYWFAINARWFGGLDSFHDWKLDNWS